MKEKQGRKLETHSSPKGTQGWESVWGSKGQRARASPAGGVCEKSRPALISECEGLAAAAPPPPPGGQSQLKKQKAGLVFEISIAVQKKSSDWLRLCLTDSCSAA